MTAKIIPADVEVENGGSIFIFRLITGSAKLWVDDNVTEPMWFGHGLAVDHRYAEDLAHGMQESGLVIR